MQLRASENSQPDSSEGQAILYLELRGGNLKLQQHLGERLAKAIIYRHPTGGKQTSDGVTAKGQLSVGEFEDDEEICKYVEIVCFLPADSFDAVASALVAGGKELLSCCKLHIGLKDEKRNIDYEKREGALHNIEFILEDLAISFEIGQQFDEIDPD